MKVFYPQSANTIYPREVQEQTWDLLRSQLEPGIEFIASVELPDPPDYNVLVAGRPTKEQLEASPNLRTLIVPWAGFSDGLADLMNEYPHISVHNLHHNAVTTAETALMLLLTAAKRIIPIESSFRTHDWRSRYDQNEAMLLSGKTVLILGYGHIGQRVARVCQALGMKVLAIRQNPNAPGPKDIQAEVHPPADLHALLPRTNILMVTLPGTEDTRGLVGEEELALMPEDGIVVNVGRGPVIDQEALYNALKSGKLHSAGIDVWYNYPQDDKARAHTPPADFPFHELENIVMSPHRGGGASEVESLRMAHLADLLNAAARGDEVPNRVDLKRGY